MKKPKLPSLLARKLSKTGQTRGAEDDEIYQNRVSRCSTVLIPFHQWEKDNILRNNTDFFENGYIVLISPTDYFSEESPSAKLASLNLELGNNCLVFYETRSDWENFSPNEMGWACADSRTAPLGGNYVARVPANTSLDNVRAQKINLGFSSKSLKGAGIRLYEYANSQTINACRLQLEALYWMCYDSIDVVVSNGMTIDDAEFRKQTTIQECQEKGLLDLERLQEARILNKYNRTICPLCLHELSGNGFFNRLDIPEGREVPDLTVTQVNLFHIEELKYGSFNHRPYNLGWGCHFCNIVVKDSGIYPTLQWMCDVINDNSNAHYIV